jgi:hypothetical protein
MATTYYWRTDAASGEIMAASAEDALATLIAQGEWSSDPRREARDIADGAWLRIGKEREAALAEIKRGTIG